MSGSSSTIRILEADASTGIANLGGSLASIPASRQKVPQHDRAEHHLADAGQDEEGLEPAEPGEGDDEVDAVLQLEAAPAGVEGGGRPAGRLHGDPEPRADQGAASGN